MMHKKTVDDLKVTGKRVLVRCDFTSQGRRDYGRKQNYSGFADHQKAD